MNTETKKDQFEQFIEMVIEKAKARPLSANVSLVMIGLMALGGLNISIAMYDASFMDEDLLASAAWRWHPPCPHFLDMAPLSLGFGR